MSHKNSLFRLFIVMLFAFAEMMTCAQLSLAQSFTLGQSAGSGTSQESWQLAQSIIDVEPPLIEHEIVSESDADIRQTFVATVVDDQELDTVQLFYRYEGESRYTRSVMSRVSYSSTWIAQIPTDPANPRAMEYYIQAQDMSGNRTVRGYAFNPLIRKINSVTIADAPVVQPQLAEPAKTPGSRKVLYVVGGVLLLGLVAAAASDDSGEPGPPPSTCTGGSCTVTISTVRPF